MSILNSSWIECFLRAKGIFIFRSILANKSHPKARPECLTGFLTNEADICCICPSFSCWSQLVNQALQVLNCCPAAKSNTFISLTVWVKSQSGIQTQVSRHHSIVSHTRPLGNSARTGHEECFVLWNHWIARLFNIKLSNGPTMCYIHLGQSPSFGLLNVQPAWIIGCSSESWST